MFFSKAASTADHGLLLVSRVNAKLINRSSSAASCKTIQYAS